MKVFYSDHFVLPLPEGHRFPMVKYSMLRERVARDGICGPGELSTPRAVTDQEILRSHAPDYLKRVVSGTLTQKEKAHRFPLVGEDGGTLPPRLGRYALSVPRRAR